MSWSYCVTTWQNKTFRSKQNDITHTHDIICRPLLEDFNFIYSYALMEACHGRASSRLTILFRKCFNSWVWDKTAWWIIIKITFNIFSIIIDWVYFRASLISSETLELFYITVVDVWEQYPNILFLLTGDFNASIGKLGELNWEIFECAALSHQCCSKDQIINVSGSRFLECMNEKECILLNGRSKNNCHAEYTFCSSQAASCID